MPVLALAALLVVAGIPWSACASAPKPGGPAVIAAQTLRLVAVGRFAAPTYVTAPPGDYARVFVTERAGTVRIVKRGRKLPRAFLDIRNRVSTEGEGGLLSLAFAPDYRRSRRFYVYYTDRRGYITIDQFQSDPRDPDRALAGSRRPVIVQPHFRANHKGGQILFGPDGYLWTAFGDGGGGGDPDDNAQNLGTLLGKLLRIKPRSQGGYTVPRSNPFVGRTGRDEIYAYGLRNPYRFSFDRLRGHLLIPDVGQDAAEELNILRSPGGRRPPRGGVNFGWPVFEGLLRYRTKESLRGPGRYVRPVVQELHSRLPVCSIIGGYVIRDPALGRFRGRYVYGDLCDSRIRLAALPRGRRPSVRYTGLRVPSLVSFGEDARGRIYVVSLEGGVWRLAAGR
ncbi:PQQ-dependent sugar dehydrogenase [Thermoleophilum album]|uniref:PQQ-dependent sugar dehydrogenase n=1 Tax=Thermoleophilum album TaxID=29539 RepID=UPI00237CE15C|nr:PQQ-dependent sugar dehydrogenase [Thermoleophilum album]WDT93423.1 PQQ-dependent sugar dehydrogenase [Thermoleophilum album]